MKRAASLGHGGEARPACAAAPQRGGLAVEHHLGAVAGAVEEDRLEVAIAVEAEAVERVAGEQHEPGALGAERHRLALEVVDRAVGAVAAHHEHAGRGVHRGEDAQVGRRAADAVERLVRHLALHQRNVELAGLEQRHVLGAALGVLRLDLEGRVHLVDGGGDRIAVDGKAAAGRGGAERHDGLARLRGGKSERQHGQHQREARQHFKPHGRNPPYRLLRLNRGLAFASASPTSTGETGSLVVTRRRSRGWLASS